MTPNFSTVENITAVGIVLGWSFFTVSFIVQFTILFFICCALILFVITFFPHRWLVFFLAIMFSGTLVSALLADAMAYALYQMHYASVAWEIFQAGAVKEVILLSVPERIFLLVMVCILLLVESLIAFLVWRAIVRRESRGIGYAIASVLIVLFTISYGSMFITTALASKRWLSPSESHVILKAARVIPYYNDIYGIIMPGDQSVRKIETDHNEIYFQVRHNDKKLNYPLSPLQCTKPQKKLNVLIIMVDTWRHDSMNQTVMPNIHQFSQEMLQFQDHWSGGNSTEPGVFTLFYSIPPNYWGAFLRQEKPPVIINQFLKDGYEMGIFTSAPLNFPAFHKTIFKEITHLIVRTKGKSSVERDRIITKRFKNFIKKRDKKQPFFSFLFYDAAHNYCESAASHQKPFQPAVKECDRFSLTAKSKREPYVNRYHNALYFIDNEVGEVIAALKKQGLLKDTIVMITGDHGEQFNDEGMNYWNHASAYTAYQLQVPLLIYWPGVKPRIYSYMTTHYDIVPTLLTHVLSCASPLADYSIGKSLFTAGGRSYLIAGSYADYAVVTKNQITRIYPGGDYVINYPNGKYNPEGNLDAQALHRVFEELNRYFQK